MSAGGNMGRELDVLIHAGSDAPSDMVEALQRLALQVRVVRGDSPPPRRRRIWAAGVILAETDQDVIDGLAAFQRFAPGERPVLVVGPGRIGPQDQIDAWMRSPAPPVQIAARVRALVRLHTMEIIARHRTEATALYGRRGDGVERREPKPCVLYVGDASPRFMALRFALEQEGAELIAAFSSYSAFDYLHERPFDAVVLNATGKRDIAFTISSAMRRNARLYHTPVLLLTDQVDSEMAEEAFARGVSDILPPSSDEAELRERIMTLTAERRRRRQAKAALEACREPRTLEIETGLFQPGFLTSHIADLLQASARDELQFSAIALEVLLPEGANQPDAASAEKARRQFAAMLRHLLRSEDGACRIASSVFLAVLPFTDAAGIGSVAARVSAIAECTAFESQDPLQPFRLSVRAAPVLVRPGETADELVDRAVRSLRSNVSPLSAQG
ncbi:PleD family two-component system response regulator [Maricaulis sp. CAU 1757]